MSIRGGSSSGQLGHDGERSPSIQQLQINGNGYLMELPKLRYRHPNWSCTETTVLLMCLKEGGLFRKGKIVNWEAIGKKIVDVCGSTRTKEECQNRCDLLTKAHKVVRNTSGGNYKQFFETTEKKRPAKLPTRFTLEWYEYMEKIKQQQQQPCHLSSSDSGVSPSLGRTQTPSRSDLISSPENSPSPDPTQVHSSELVVHPNLHDGQDWGALWPLDCAPCDQEVQDCAQLEGLFMTIEELEDFSVLLDNIIS